MRKKRIILFSLSAAVVFILCLYVSGIYSFLALTSPADADILVVEGWVPKETLDKAYAEFHASDYRYLITTGFPYYKGFTVGSYGELRFRINERQKQADTSLLITLTARGTKAFDEYPHFKLFADTVPVGESFTHSRIRDYTFRCRLTFVPALIVIAFDNDTYSRYRDRDLIVYSLTVNGVNFTVNDTHVSYFKQSTGMDKPSAILNVSTAHETAANLCKMGIPDSLVIPVGSRRKIKSRTYTNAVDVYQWMQKNDAIRGSSVNILTSGSHARRSYVSYRKAIGDSSIKIGVISCHDVEVNQTNWWKSFKGLKEILYETTGYLYAKILL